MTGLPRFNTYRAADTRWGIIWNDYDYRPSGGKRYRIGIAAVINGHVFGLRWARPGNQTGRHR